MRVSSLTETNDIYFQRVTEMLNADLPYNGYNIIALQTSAKYTGTTFPTVSFDQYLRKIAVPSNYNAATRTYSGVWDGTFSGTKVVSDHPAFVLLGVLTDPLDGAGIPIANINIFSVY